ncbi:MAG: hypothetical protein WD468_10265 [Pirellulales bacterium]
MKLLIAIVSVLLLCGCNRASDTKRVVMGTVKYQGKAIPFGKILLMPDADTQAPPAGTFISDGEYSIDAKNGVMFGSYNVEIKGFPAKPGASSVGPADPEYMVDRGQFLPAKYNAETELKLIVEPGRATLIHNFDLP